MACGPLMVIYARLTHNEEWESARCFGQAWEKYAQQVPRFIPRGAQEDSFESYT